MNKESRQYVVDRRQGKTRKSLPAIYSLLPTERKGGFTLVELLVTMVVFIIVIAASSQIFTGLLTQFKQQTKIAETNIEGVVGLEILRWDIEHAGYGLPWDLNGATYQEANNDSNTAHDDTLFNDSPGNPPRAIISGNGSGVNNSDVLVIKAVNIARNAASSKWTHLFMGNIVTEWEPDTERLKTSDRVIVLTPNTRRLIVSDGNFTTRYRTETSPDSLVDASFAPLEDIDTRIVYGVAASANPVGTPLRMPFNRADYYVRTPTTNFPLRCATGTGILYKATVDQGGNNGSEGGGLSELPLLDCVADMQVVFGMDTDDNGSVNCYTNNLSDVLATVDAENIRNEVKEVRAYILAHEGQIDRTFTFASNPIIRVGEALGSCTGEAVLGRDFDLSAITDWQNYRWKVYTIVVKPNNLG